MSFRTSPLKWCGNLHRIPGSLSSYRLPFLRRFPVFIHEKLCFYPGDCHASVRYFIAMTRNSAPCHHTTERYRAAQGRNDYTNLPHDLAARPAGKFPICRSVCLYPAAYNPCMCKEGTQQNALPCALGVLRIKDNWFRSCPAAPRAPGRAGGTGAGYPGGAAYRRPGSGTGTGRWPG